MYQTTWHFDVIYLKIAEPCLISIPGLLVVLLHAISLLSEVPGRGLQIFLLLDVEDVKTWCAFGKYVEN